MMLYFISFWDKNILNLLDIIDRMLTRLSLFTDFTWENIYKWKSTSSTVTFYALGCFLPYLPKHSMSSYIFSHISMGRAFPSLGKAFNLLLSPGSLQQIPWVGAFQINSFRKNFLRLSPSLTFIRLHCNCHTHYLPH